MKRMTGPILALVIGILMAYSSLVFMLIGLVVAVATGLVLAIARPWSFLGLYLMGFGTAGIILLLRVVTSAQTVCPQMNNGPAGTTCYSATSIPALYVFAGVALVGLLIFWIHGRRTRSAPTA